MSTSSGFIPVDPPELPPDPNEGNFSIGGDASFGSNLDVSGDASFGSNLVVSGNVGIGTTIPQHNLDVNGSINCQNLTITQGLNITGVSTFALTPTSNLIEDSTLTFELVDDTTLAIKVRGTDGVIRSANILLS
jgi:hypothetical protein